MFIDFLNSKHDLLGEAISKEKNEIKKKIHICGDELINMLNSYDYKSIHKVIR